MSDLKRYQREDSGNLGESYDFLKGRVGQAKKAIRRGPGGIVDRILEFYRKGMGNVNQGVGSEDMYLGPQGLGNAVVDMWTYPGVEPEIDEEMMELWASIPDEEKGQWGSFEEFRKRQRALRGGR